MAEKQVIARVRLDDVERDLGQVRLDPVERVEPVKREGNPSVVAKHDLAERVVEGIEVAVPWRVSEVLLEPKSLGEAGDKRRPRPRVDPVHQIAESGELVDR